MPIRGGGVCAALMLALIWLCPLWLGPTPAVMPLLWSGLGLSVVILLTTRLGWKQQVLPAKELTSFRIFGVLLVSLALMMTWRSASSANAVAAALCLLAIGLSAALGLQLQQQGRPQLIAWGWLLAGLANAGIALCQYFGLTSEPTGTAFGLLRQRNQMATLCNIALLALLYVGAQNSPADLTRKVLATIASVLLCAALVATCSRTGILQFILIWLALGGLLLRRNRSHATAFLLWAALLALVMALALALPPAAGVSETLFGRVIERGQGEGAVSTDYSESRRYLWHNAWQLIQQQPWLGVGWREFAQAMQLTDFGAAGRFAVQADHTHNLILQFAVELGLPFTLLWSSLLLYWLVSLKPWRATTPGQRLGWGVFALIAIHSMLEYPLWYGPFQIALGLALGLVMPSTVSEAAKPLRLHVPRVISAGLLGFCAYAAFDYHRVSQLFLATDQRADIYQSDTMAKVEGSWLFANQVRFAKLLTTPVTDHNARAMWTLGQQVLHFSPEPRVLKVMLTAGALLAPTDTTIAQELTVLKRQLALIER